ncbi:unnamed protein product [Protopolystoma xenopodis]|uniref:Guanylate kinase-like domain-containing protein n=1 Tax=Protopolystoma xenopodis TaxID=117903 RepID=A0A448WAT4_9PLAT|nr:unnamed protein product [Protopolystoma xenopodis]
MPTTCSLHTTRPPRPGEVDGIDFYFVSDAINLRLHDPAIQGPLDVPLFSLIHSSRPPSPSPSPSFVNLPSKSTPEVPIDITPSTPDKNQETHQTLHFIEVGQFQTHTYATSAEAVCQIARKGQICLLDVSLAAVKRLRVGFITICFRLLS